MVRITMRTSTMNTWHRRQISEKAEDGKDGKDGANCDQTMFEAE